MSLIGELLAEPERDFRPSAADSLAAELQSNTDFAVYPRSITKVGRQLFFLGRRGHEKILAVLSTKEASTIEGKRERISLGGGSYHLQIGPTSHENAVVLRQQLPYSAPGLVGQQASFGMGDRLGLATPGHIRAIRKHRLVPVLAQQSIREMERTGRTPVQVVDDASWGVFQEGFRDGWGADADHLKNTADIDRCQEAGFRLFTLDPSEQISGAGAEQTVPWDALDTNFSDACRRYLGSHSLEAGLPVEIDRAIVARFFSLYGKALAKVLELWRHLAKTCHGLPFEVEVSLDESAAETSPEEHFLFASELRRHGLELHSLALHYPGRFEKGRDYLGDWRRFEESFARHLAVASTVGPYKLGIHSGSDKFSLYPVLARLAGGRFHLKTAGTSYLEALRLIAAGQPDLFLEIAAVACECYTKDRVSYCVSAEPERLPDFARLRPADLAKSLDDPEVRQLLHVTFGSVMRARSREGAALGEKLMAYLRAHEEEHYAVLEAHFERHLGPLGCRVS